MICWISASSVWKWLNCFLYILSSCVHVYNNVQTRQIHELTQGNGAFILIACYRNFWDREVHERDIEKKIQNITSSVNICVTIIYNFLLAMVVWPQDNLCLFMLRSVHPPKTAKLL